MLKRRELRDLLVVNGLDRQDEDYARHRQENLSESGLRQWLNAAPSLPLIDVAAGLLDRPSDVPPDRLALAERDSVKADGLLLAGDEAIDAAILPNFRQLWDVQDHAASSWAASSLKDDRAAGNKARTGARNGQIRLIGDTAEAEGVFIAPNYILTPSNAIGNRGLIDVEDAPGHVALGLIVAVDHSLGLALVQSPGTGQPVAIGIGASKSDLRSRMSPPMNAAVSAPILVGGELIGFKTSNGLDIDGDAINIFLEQQQQQHLLPKSWKEASRR